jgi:hypothetical protein
VQCDLKLEIDDLLKEPEISVKEYFTTLTWDKSAELTRGELTYMGRLAVWQVFAFIRGVRFLSDRGWHGSMPFARSVSRNKPTIAGASNMAAWEQIN